jgi:AraC-like DNA-binding protein
LVLVLIDNLVTRTGRPTKPDLVGQSAPQFMKLHAGHLSIDDMASSYGLNRQQFARKFHAAAGLPPKLFARITRFQALVQVLLSTDVSQWASLSTAVGFYDQAHMINDFRAFAGSPPTVFFRPRCSEIHAGRIQLRGRPSEWLIRPEGSPPPNP